MKNNSCRSPKNDFPNRNLTILRNSTSKNNKKHKLSLKEVTNPFRINRRLPEQNSQNPLQYLLYQALQEKVSQKECCSLKTLFPKISNDKFNRLIKKKLKVLRTNSIEYTPREVLFKKNFFNKLNSPINSLLSTLDIDQNSDSFDKTKKTLVREPISISISSRGYSMLKKSSSTNGISGILSEENLIQREKPKILSLKTNKNMPRPVLRTNLLKGYKGKSQAGKSSQHPNQNQDTFLVMNLIFDIIDFNLFAVFDGHGLNGYFISNFTKNYFKESILQNKLLAKSRSIKELYECLTENNYSLIRNLFRTAEEQLVKLKTVDFNNSGTTAIVVFQIGPHLITANVGDSRAIAVEEKNKTFPLSYDHKPSNLTERNRIEKSGGRIEQYKENGIKAGAFRVWLKGEIQPGLTITRSIGDLIATPIGVFCDPEIVEYNIHNGLNYIILASDGVWEFIDNSNTAILTRPYYENNDPSGLCQKLICEATKAWEKEDVVIDDITVVTAFY